ncbi:acyltransferase [uncultured Prochlorococcus sp.]|uniref:acyltransferase family protein n=1 Tax=uncultured Prochlorococcus sp. TaxID=159733 RepID=UPI00258A5E4F|nr:acyltransferase [uncultured Prochlorococcus sp.]
MRIKHIDGLRALSIIIVVIYHSFPDFLPNGYLGVDYFLVISGYVISKKYFVNSNNKFSFLEFWKKRIQRLYPQLLVCITIIFIAGFFMMQPDYYENLSQSTIASLFGMNNFLLLINGGYWSLTNDLRPLFTTWSLGLEEQFYMFISVLNVLIISLSKTNKKLIQIISIFAFLSFIASYYGYNLNPEANYLLLPFRFWEFSIGILSAYYAIKIRPYISIWMINLSFLIISTSFLLPFKTIKYAPNPLFIFPLAAIAIICISDKKSIFIKFLSLPPIVYLGLSSYSIYLYHQPILVFARLTSYYKLDNNILFILILLSFITGFIMYELVERKIFFKFIKSEKIDFIFKPKFLFSWALLIISFSIIVINTYGLFHLRFANLKINDEIPIGLLGGKYYNDSANKFLFRSFNSKSLTSQNKELKTINLLFIGNSKTRDLINSFQIIDFNLKDIEFIISYSNSIDETLKREQKLKILELSDLIFIQDDNLSIPEEFKKYKKKIVADRKRENFVYNINPALYEENRSNLSIKNSDKRKCEIDFTYQEFQRNSNLYNKVLDTQCAFNLENGRKLIASDKGEIYTFDGIHLSYAGGKKLADVLVSNDLFLKLIKNK